MLRASELMLSKELITWYINVKGASVSDIVAHLKMSNRCIYRILASAESMQKVKDFEDFVQQVNEMKDIYFKWCLIRMFLC